MKAGFQFITHFFFRYRLCLVITVVIIFHMQILFYISGQIKIQSHDLAPQKVMSATVIKGSGTNSLSPVKLNPRDLSTVPVAVPKYVQTDTASKSKRYDIKETSTATHIRKNEDISNSAVLNKGSDSRKSKALIKTADSTESADLMKSADSSQNTVPIESAQANSDAIGNSRSDLNSLSHTVIHLSNPRFKDSRPVPAYPQEALRMREEGLVVIRVLVSQSGRVTQAMIQQSSGSVWLDSAAKNAALKAQFNPHIINGVAHRTQADLPFKFVMK